MAIAVVLILLVIGSVIFHFASPWWFTPIASNWGMIDNTVFITFWVTGAVFIAVNLFMAWCVVKYRHGKTDAAHYEPENPKLELWLTVITSIGVAAMLAPGLWVWAKFVEVPEGAMEVEVVGQQWHWSYRFPGEDGVFGTTGAQLITPSNPFGMNADDPAGQDDILVASPELHLPVDQPVKALLRSKDVLHNFAVPQFRVKMDLVPGMVSYVWLEPNRVGTYEILCEELCGLAHHTMRGSVVVDESGDFDTWLASHPTWGELQARADGDPATGQALYASCAACHGAQGEGNQALNAPRLAGLDRGYIERQLKNFKRGWRGAHEDDTYGRQMAPMAAVLADQAAIDHVTAYIATLEAPAPEPTVSGDAGHGRELYVTCSACHGVQGEGVWSANAPRLAGVQDWYLKRQIQNFADGVRGGHAQDRYGWQMGLMADALGGEEAINDVVAYINTLSGVKPERKQRTVPDVHHVTDSRSH